MIAIAIWWLTMSVIVGALATWRVAAYLYTDKGLFGEMQRLRDRISHGDGWLLEQFTCFWCLSIWAAIFVTPVALIAWPMLVPVAFSGVAILLSHGGRTIWRYIESDG